MFHFYVQGLAQGLHTLVIPVRFEQRDVSVIVHLEGIDNVDGHPASSLCRSRLHGKEGHGFSTTHHNALNLGREHHGELMTTLI